MFIFTINDSYQKKYFYFFVLFVNTVNHMTRVIWNTIVQVVKFFVEKKVNIVKDVIGKSNIHPPLPYQYHYNFY